MRLNELQPGQRGIIRRIGGIGAFRRRLLDMGLLPGEEIAVIRLAPLGSPTEYRIKNSVASCGRSCKLPGGKS